jgi:CRP/FNR family cyclic AMP-dependent transcriptional regulator
LHACTLKPPFAPAPPPSAGDELDGIPWLALLLPPSASALSTTCAWATRCRRLRLPRRRPVTYWFGVVDGLLKMSSDNAEGQTMTFTGVPPGGWFGEGTALKREVYRYNIQALRKSVVAGCRWTPSTGCWTTPSASTAS